MSSDLLRRAAAKLREHVQDLPALWRGNEWFPVFTDSLTGVRTCSKGHAADTQSDACDWCDDFETYSEPSAAYIALMQPTVALALADVFEALAGAITTAGACRDQRLEAVACAVLRLERDHG